VRIALGINIFASLGSMLFYTLILVEFCQILDKINDEKRVDLSLFLFYFWWCF